MMKKGLVFGIIVLFIGMGVVSSSYNIVKDTQTNYQFKDTIDVSKELLSNGKIAYCSMVIGGGEERLYWFELNDTGTMNFLANSESGDFLAGGTWTCDGEWYVCEYITGWLWKINPDNGDMENIGGGGTSCNGLSWDPVYNRLYGASSTHLIEYNPETGEQETIGSFGLPGKTIIGLAIDSEGVAYIWDVLSGGPSTLWTVDLDTGEATEVGSLGINLMYNADGHFDYETDILYITSDHLYECDEDTGNCTVVGNFYGWEINCFAIPYDTTPPVTNISFDPPEPDGLNGWYVSDVIVTLNATDDVSGVNATYYRINGGEWETYESPFVISEDGDDIPIEYYSIDNAGNQESHKHATIDMDQTEPCIVIMYEVTGGNPEEGWDLLFTATAVDAMSGMNRVGFYLNNELQDTVYGPGPTYCWGYHYPPNPFRVIGLIRNPEITDEYVKFYAIIVRISELIGYPHFCAYAYDNAGNWDYDEILQPCPQVTISPGFYLFQNLTLTNNYTGYIGKYLISAIFNYS